MEMCRSMEDEGYYTSGKALNGWPKVAIELLVLGGMRILGSGCSFDVIEDLTNVNETTHCKLFHKKVCRWGTGLSNVLVNLPRNEAEIRHVTGLYEIVGMPGCIGSIDCVHLVWDKCPAGFLSALKGK